MSDDTTLLAEWVRQEWLREEFRHTNARDFFEPVDKQLEFISLTGAKSEAMLMAGNACGKTETAAFMTACHLTGEYPPWWRGRRWTRPVKAWVCGTSGIAVRDAAQIKLCGPPGDFGSGMLPKLSFDGSPAASRSASGAYESWRVKHISGGVSNVAIKTYDQKREDWQGPDRDWIWYDEEPDLDHYAEGQARLRGRGSSILTFTPLKGNSEVVNRFLNNRPGTTDYSPYRGYIQMSLDEATWWTDEEKDKQVAGYPVWQRDARRRGIPMLGEGAIMQVPLSDLILPASVDLAHVPLHIRKIWGIDFGIDHPFAAILCLIDDENKEFIAAREVYMRGANVITQARAIRDIAPNVPVAWPHDGHEREKGSGEELQVLYKREGLNMLGEHATNPTGGNSVYSAVTALLHQMDLRKFKIDPRCVNLIRELGTWHLEKGQIVKLQDDAISAMRYAHMMQRRARAVPVGASPFGRGGFQKGVLPGRRRQEAEIIDPWTGREITRH